MAYLLDCIGFASGDVRLYDRRRNPLHPNVQMLRYRDPMRLADPAVDRVLRLWVLPNLTRNVLVAHADGSVRLWDARAATRPLREFGVLSKSLARKSSATSLLPAFESGDTSASGDEQQQQHSLDSSASEAIPPTQSTTASTRPQVGSTSSAVLSVARHPHANLLAFGAADSDEDPVQIVRETRDEPAARRLHSLRHHSGFAARRIAPALSLSFHPSLCRLAVASLDSVVSVFALKDSGNDLY